MLRLPENCPVSSRECERLGSVPRAFCVIAGDGPLRNGVDHLAAKLLPGRFLRSTFPHELMRVLYRSANVFLHAAVRESFGNVYIEALVSGTPIVAHNDEVTRWIFKLNFLLFAL
jgi:glycosyltransferase involved in cell wall biosynthesis